MKRIFFLLLSALVVATSFSAAYPNSQPAKAYSNSNMIDDVVFDNAGTMSTASIQAFLNQFPNSCLKNYSDEYPNDYFSYGGAVSAATVIRRASDLWGINPQVLLAKLEQEENLVTGNAGCALWRYVSAVGFNCPGPTRSAVFRGTPVTTCVQNDVNMGFSRQVTKGAWLLKWGKERALGNLNWLVPDDASYYYGGPMTQGVRKRSASAAAVYYDGYWNGVPMGSGATASLYNYTPYLGQAFSGIFESFFGAGTTSAKARDYSLYSSTQSVLWTNPGQVITNNDIQIKNTGTTTWYPDGNVPPGEQPTRLALAGYKNTPFADTSDPAWMGTQNQIKMTLPTVPVPPGEYARFIFRLKGPSNQFLNNYVNHFIPVKDGVAFYPDKNMHFITHNIPPNYQFVSATSPPQTMLSNQTSTQTIIIKNTSQIPWYADGSAPPGVNPVRLAGYQSNPYANLLDPSWLGTTSNIKMAPSQVNPGSNASFTFSYLAPFSGQNQYYKFVPVMMNTGAFNDIGMAFSTNTPSPNYSYQYISSISPPATMSPGSKANVQLVLKNTGNTIWRNDDNASGLPTTHLGFVKPLDHQSTYYQSGNQGWLNSIRVKLTTPTVAPGENGIFNFEITAPNNPGTYTDWFSPVIDPIRWMPDIGMGFKIKVE